MTPRGYGAAPFAVGGIVRNLVIVLAVLASSLASAAAPSEGVPLAVRRGFFTETDVGGFVAFGGQDGYSNLTPFLQLGVGYDVLEHLEIGVHVGIGASAQNCFSKRNAKGDCVPTATASTGTSAVVLSDNFTVTFVSVSAAYLFQLAERFYIAPKLVGGITLLDPAPVQDASGNLVRFGAHIGAAIGLEYATSMDHFSVGVDVTFRAILGPNIFALQFYPRVKYTF